MQIKGLVVDVNGAPVAAARVEVRGTATARVMIPVDDETGFHKPRIGTTTQSSSPVQVTTGEDGAFSATVETPTIAGADDDGGGRVIGAPTYGAIARALGSVGETLASASATGAGRPDLDVGTLHLPSPGPAFQTTTVGGTLQLAGNETHRLPEIVSVGAGPLQLQATTLQRVAEPPDETHLHPIFRWEPDQPAGFRAFPLEGTGASLDGEGSGQVDVGANDGGPRHTWAIRVKNPSAQPARVQWRASYTTTHPIKKKLIKLTDLNDSVWRLLQVGPADVSEPPLRLVIGQQLRIAVRPDWQQLFGSLSSFDLPGIVTINQTGTARPVLQFQQIGDDLALVMDLQCDVGTITGSVLGGWVGTVEATNLSARFVFTFKVEQQMIVPVCTGFTDARLDTDAGLLLILADILTLGVTQVVADQVAGGVTDALRNAVRFDIPAAIAAKRFQFGKKISAFFAGPDRPVLDLSVDNGAVTVTYVDDEQDPLPSLDPETADPTLANKIDHVVVLMMENRSFDHMLGYLERDGGRDDVDGLNKPDARGNTGQWNAHGDQQYQPFRLAKTKVPVDVDPCHSSGCVAAQIGADLGMHGFVESFAAKIAQHPGCKSAAQDVMGYHGADHVWAYDAIAENFAVCDRWFASHPGPTWPNRYFLIACHLGIGPDGGPDVDMTGDPTPIEMDTIFDELTRRNVSWRYFEHDVGFLRKIAKYTLDFERVVTIDQPDTGFYDLAKRGALPSVTFIDPNFDDFPDGQPASDDHPPTDIAPGQDLVARIYNALRKGPQWERTLFVITYDEHGGLYDHYPPPPAVAPPGSLGTLGVRVPAMVISPWIPARSVSHAVFDHTVVAKTIFRRFTPEAIPDLGVRFRAAPDLGSLLSLEQPRTDTIAEIVRPAGAKPTERATSPSPIDADDTLRNSLRALRAYVDARRPPGARRTP